LVSLALIDFSSAGILLKCTSAEFDTLDHAEETQFLPGTGGRAAYVAGRPLPEPYEGLVDVIGEVPQAVTYDTIPRGEVELRGDDPVEATDGEIGRVRGLVVDRGSGHVVYLLVHESHVWGRRELAIPIEDVAVIADGIRLNIAKGEVQKMSAGISHAWRGTGHDTSAAGSQDRARDKYRLDNPPRVRS